MAKNETTATPLEQAVSKREYLKFLASPKVKKSTKFAKIVALVCVLIMVIGYISAMNTSLEDIPVMSVALSASGGTKAFEDVKISAQDMMELVDDKVDEYEDELKDMMSKKEYRQFEKFIKLLSNTTKTISINNLKRLTTSLENMNAEVTEKLNLKESSEDLSSITSILNTISSVLMIFLIITLVFTVLGALFRSNVMLVIGMILTSLYCLIFCGVLFLILNLVAHIAVLYLQNQLKKEYKAYCAGSLNS